MDRRVRQWPEGGLPAARRIALDRLRQMRTDTANKKHCSELGYGLLR